MLDLKGTKNADGSDDEKLGSVSDALVEDRTGDLRYLLVDSGGDRKTRAVSWFQPIRCTPAATESILVSGQSERKADVEAWPQFRDDALLSNTAFNNLRIRLPAQLALLPCADPARVRASSRLHAFGTVFTM